MYSNVLEGGGVTLTIYGSALTIIVRTNVHRPTIYAHPL